LFSNLDWGFSFVWEGEEKREYVGRTSSDELYVADHELVLTQQGKGWMVKDLLKY